VPVHERGQVWVDVATMLAAGELAQQFQRDHGRPAIVGFSRRPASLRRITRAWWSPTRR
jgi:hypothetical protein